MTKPSKLPAVGTEGMATWRGLTFRAKVLCIVSRRDGPALSVAAVRMEEARFLPAATLLVRPADFVPAG